jgi:hypothetical protein
MRRGFPSETSITCKKEGKIYVEGRILRSVTMSRDNLPVQVARFMDEIRSFLNARGFLRHLTIRLSEKYTSLHYIQETR